MIELVSHIRSCRSAAPYPGHAQKPTSQEESDGRQEISWPKKPVLWALLLLGLFTCFHQFTLLRFPAPFVDEAWRANRAQALIETGYPFGTMDRGVFDRFPGYWRFPPYLEIWFTSLPMRWFGFSLLAVRMTSLFFGMVLLVTVYSISSSVGSPLSGLLAILAQGTCTSFLISSHLGRQDIMVAAFGYGAVACCLMANRCFPRALSFAAGVLAGLAFAVHPNGAVFIFVLFCSVISNRRSSTDYRKLFRFTAIGVLLMFFGYFLWHVVPYPQTYRQTTHLGYAATHTPPGLILDPQLWLESLWETLKLAMGIDHIHAALGLWGAIAVLRCPERRSVAGTVLVTATVVAIALAIRTKRNYYGILLSPALSVTFALAFEDYVRQLGHSISSRARRQGVLQGLVLLVFCGSLVYGTTRNLQILKLDPMPEYEKTVTSIAEVVPPRTTIMGSQTYWFGLTNRDYMSWEQIIYLGRLKPQASLSEILKELAPEYLLIDDHMRGFVHEEIPTHHVDPYMVHLSLPRDEFELAIQTQYELVATVESELYGRIELHRISQR